MLGREHIDTLKAKYNYANILRRLSRRREAEKLYLEIIGASYLRKECDYVLKAAQSQLQSLENS